MDPACPDLLVPPGDAALDSREPLPFRSGSACSLIPAVLPRTSLKVHLAEHKWPACVSLCPCVRGRKASLLFCLYPRRQDNTESGYRI